MASFGATTTSEDPALGSELSEAEAPLESTSVGYTGGSTSLPTYSTVCGGDGHSEAVRVVYDPSKISYEKLLDEFFKMHAYQYKSKAQYKSAVFVQNDAQKHAVEAKIQSLRARDDVATEILPKSPWNDAEEYHQNFLKKKGRRMF